MKLKPLSDNIVIKPLAKEEKTANGIIIPDTVGKEKPEQGEVVAVGLGKVDSEGKRLPMDIKLGDKVIFKKYSPDEFKIDNQVLLILSASDVLAIIE
jgi:chaperonin GroES